MNEKIKALSEFFKSGKQDKIRVLILAVAAFGIILIVLSSLSESEDSGAEETTAKSQGFSEAEYSENLENKLEEMISSLAGAGRTKVVITLECDYETVYAKDGSYSRDELSSDEKSEYIIIDSSEQEDGLVLKTVTPKVRGAAVLCEGGADAGVRQAVSEMLSALLDIGTNQISVSKIQ